MANFYLKYHPFSGIYILYRKHFRQNDLGKLVLIDTKYSSRQKAAARLNRYKI